VDGIFLFAQIPPKQRAQSGGRQHRDRLAFDGEQFLFAEFGERAGEGFTDRAEFRREYAQMAAKTIWSSSGRVCC
jgi:hypothetical protein